MEEVASIVGVGSELSSRRPPRGSLSSVNGEEGGFTDAGRVLDGVGLNLGVLRWCRDGVAGDGDLRRGESVGFGVN
jgi:hypothetical protein